MLVYHLPYVQIASSQIASLNTIFRRNCFVWASWCLLCQFSQAISLGTFFADRNTLLLLRFLAGLAEGGEYGGILRKWDVGHT